MVTNTRTSFSMRIGRRLGQAWRGWLRLLDRAKHGLVRKGFPLQAATALLWAVQAIVLGVLLYAAFSFFVVFAVTVGLLLALMSGGTQTTAEETTYESGEDDPRQQPGYDPVFYNDYGDPNYPDKAD